MTQTAGALDLPYAWARACIYYALLHVYISYRGITEDYCLCFSKPGCRPASTTVLSSDMEVSRRKAMYDAGVTICSEPKKCNIMTSTLTS